MAIKKSNIDAVAGIIGLSLLVGWEVPIVLPMIIGICLGLVVDSLTEIIIGILTVNLLILIPIYILTYYVTGTAMPIALLFARITTYGMATDFKLVLVLIILNFISSFSIAYITFRLRKKEEETMIAYENGFVVYPFKPLSNEYTVEEQFLHAINQVSKDKKFRDLILEVIGENKIKNEDLSDIIKYNCYKSKIEIINNDEKIIYIRECKKNSLQMHIFKEQEKNVKAILKIPISANIKEGKIK